MKTLSRIACLARVRGVRWEGSYEGPGKTTVSVMNKEPLHGLLVNSYSNVGFRLNNGLRVLGPIVLFPRSIFSWNVDSADEVDERSLALFALVEPKVDVLFLGMGDPHDTRLAREKYLRICRRGTNIEVLPTHRAIGSYNFLAAEGRNVAAALIPPRIIDFTDDDLHSTRRDEGFYRDSDIFK